MTPIPDDDDLMPHENNQLVLYHPRNTKRTAESQGSRQIVRHSKPALVKSKLLIENKKDQTFRDRQVVAKNINARTTEIQAHDRLVRNSLAATNASIQAHNQQVALIREQDNDLSRQVLGSRKARRKIESKVKKYARVDDN